MSTGSRFQQTVIAVFLGSGLLCAGLPAFGTGPAQAQQQIHKGRSKKRQAEPPPPLPSGPTGRPVPPMPLDAMAAVPPQVTFENNQLTIVAPNSTLADILRAVRKQTGAEIEVPAAPERVVTHLGPGPAREVLADLLNGSRFNYVLLGSPSDQTALTRVVLVAKSGVQETAAPNPVARNIPAAPGQAVVPGQPVDTPEPDPAPEASEAEASDDNANAADDNTEQQQPAEAEQTPPEQPNGVKTPQQMLQEMQQRQMQMQQQQQGGQPPAPGGSGMPPHPPQEN